MSESDEDRLIGEWHELARVVEIGAPVDLPAATGVLNEVLRTFAPTLQSPRDQAEILPLIAGTRQLEKTWNMRLGKTLIDAGEAKKRNDLAAALTILDQFTEQCPWVPFSRIAQDQRANYAPSR
jgi:hypothetical protein